MKVIVNESQYIRLINEFKELADKIYFKTGKLDESDRLLILSITNGDNYTKFIADCLYRYKGSGNLDRKMLTSKLDILYQSAKTYNKNLFPVLGLGDFNNIQNIGDIVNSLHARYKIIRELRTLPSIVIRNLKSDTRTERNPQEFNQYLNDLEYLMNYLSMLNNRDEKSRMKIYQKMFKNNRTLDSLIDFVQEKENLIGGDEVTREELLEVIKEYEDEMTLMFHNKDVMVVRVESPIGIKAIGCNSLWCFTYGSGFDNAYRTWNDYSTNGMVYVIVDFRLPSDDVDFMNVVIKPIDFGNEGPVKQEHPDQLKIPFDDIDNLGYDAEDDEGKNDNKIYDLSNEASYSPIALLSNTIGLDVAIRILTFEMD